MKKLYTLSGLTLLASFSFAQITINSTDLMNAGEEYNMSVGDLLQTVDFTTTGANTTWDFSQLSYLTQEKDSFFSVTSLGGPLTTYPLVFNNIILFPGDISNIVQRADNSSLLSQLPIAISDIYNFYYKNTTVYRQSGMGANITGIDIPFAYDNKDIIYNFPVNFNDVDSSNSDGSIAIPNLGYFGFVRSRANAIDGWGSVITPFGTFNALRVRSVVNETDSIYVDSLSFGLSLPLPEMVEYKWLSAGQAVPILQINTTNATGTETVSSIRYRDSIHIISVNELAIGNEFNVSPNPASDGAMISFELQHNSNVTLTLYAADGRLVSEIEEGHLMAGVHNYFLKSEYLKLNNGIYFLALQANESKVFRKVVFTR